MKECPACSRCYPDHVNHCPSDGDLLKFTITGEPVLDGRYQLEKRLGQGGMGVVFKARHIFLKTQHAIKIILPDLVGNDPSLATRFRQEAMAAAAVHHPNTISVTDFGIVSGTMPFLVMEFIEGPSLHEILQREKKLTPARALEIMLAVCAGVAAAHSFGIVHRDLKPLNIILKAGRPIGEAVKVLDFGLAKIKSGELLGSFVAAQTQGMMGSPFYMAPEQWSDEDIDVRADIYSLGIILYQMLAGEVPFRGASVPSIMKKHLTDPPPPLSERGVHAPASVEAVVRHALAKEANDRPASVEVFMEELRAALDDVQREPLSNEAGQPTMRIGGDTLEALRRGQGLRAGESGTPPVRSKRVEGAGGTDTGEPQVERGGDVSAREAEIRAQLARAEAELAAFTEQSAARKAKASQENDGQSLQAGDTARQEAKRTGIHPGELSEVTRVAGADTSRAQPPVEDEEAERLRLAEQGQREEADARERAEAQARERAEAQAEQ
ncbi:MAG: protein kinase, partial [Pyrinomonadaceae bacterium]